jgi:hypothetical protein
MSPHIDICAWLYYGVSGYLEFSSGIDSMYRGIDMSARLYYGVSGYLEFSSGIDSMYRGIEMSARLYYGALDYLQVSSYINTYRIFNRAMIQIADIFNKRILNE